MDVSESTSSYAPDRQRSYANVALVERVMAVLEAANRLPSITVQAISNECDIPPSSVVRILETLCAAGYLEQLSRRGRYILTSKVQLLSAGYHESLRAVEILRPFAELLTRRNLWPVSVATLEYDAMVVRYSTIPQSPLAHARSTLHKRLSLISRAHGLAYLAFCGSAERHHLARIAFAVRRPEDRNVGGAHEWRRLIWKCRRRGYAVRAADVDPTTCTIAVPVLVEPRRVIATLGMTFFRRVLDEGQIRTCSLALKSSATEAATQLRREFGIAGSPAQDDREPD